MTPPLLGTIHGVGSLGFRWSCADNFGILARGANTTNIHLERFIAGVKRTGLDVHDMSFASGSADVHSQLVLRWNGQTDSTSSISRADGLFAPSHHRPGDGGHQWSRVLLGAHQVRAAVLFGFRGAKVNRAQGT